MNIRQRLLFLITPLAILPLLLVTIFSLFIFKQMNPASFQFYETLAVVFVALTVLVVFMMIVNISNAISKPLKLLTKDARRIAEGGLEVRANPSFHSFELDQLGEAIEKMKSEIKRQQDLIRQEAAHAAIGKMATHVAHDLAGPLSSLQAALEYFKELKAADSKTSDYVNLLELSSKRLKAISKELLDQRKGAEPKKILFSLHKILDELIGEYAAQSEYEGVEFVKQYHSQAIFLFGDRAKIQRAFGNLIKNAIEAMDKFGTLTVATKLAEGKAVIEIQDTGCGVAPEVLQRILDGEGVTQGKAGGHGIGVQVVKKTMTEHDGVLTAQSEIGIGTQFCVELPLPESQHFRGAEREEELVEAFALSVEKGKAVVVIDDDESFLEQWRLLLEKEKRSALLCVSFEDFETQKISSQPTTTAVIDYHFDNSELNGLQIIEKLKAQGFKNLYLCTAEYWKPSLKKEAEALGVTICPKPLPKIELRTADKRCLALLGKGSQKCLAPFEEGKKERGYKVVVIDDEETIRLSWELISTKLHVEKLYAFANLEGLLAEKIDLRTIDIAFVDKNIERSQYSGAETVGYLKAQGVAKVVLASGENEARLRQDPAFANVDFILNSKIPTSFKEFFS